MNQSNSDIADWNRIADRYVDQDGQDDPTQNPMYQQLHEELWDSLGDLNGLKVLDLGCGHGWLSQMMNAAGAEITGIDGAEKLLEYARGRCPEGEFVQADLADGMPSFGKKFNRIVSTMVLMDIPDLSLLMRDVSQALTEDGRFIFTMLHPCFFRYKINFDEANEEWYRRVTNYQDAQVWRVDSFGGHNHYHRNLTYYSDLLKANNLAITRLFEPEWNPEPENDHAHVVRRWPLCLLVEARPLAIQ